MNPALRHRDLQPDAYAASSAADLCRAIRAGEVSPVALAQCALDIARRAEPSINAYARLLDERALAVASERAAEAQAGRIRGPLHGVPIAVKDNFYLEGEPTGKGSLTSGPAPATASSPMVERLVAAGAVVIGLTTTPEFGWKGTGISPRTGVTRNPWNPERNSGGSSAGSGATVATGAVPIATGSDAGGSIRIPASFCGLVGMKPTLGAIPVWPGTVNENLSHAGPLTRSVEDAALVLSLTRGPDWRDPQSYFPTVSAAVSGKPKVGIVAAPFGIEPDGDVARAFDDAVTRIAAAGTCTMLPAQIEPTLPRDVFEGLWVTGRGLGFLDLFARFGPQMDPGLVRLGELAQHYSLKDFFDVMGKRRAFNAAMFRMLETYDVLIMPTLPMTAFAAAAEIPDGGEATAPLPWITWTPYTYPFNITGQPAITIPCGFDTAGLPIGLQIVGGWGKDEAVLAFAGACEAALAGPAMPRIAPGYL